MTRHGFARTLLSTCAGPIVWALHFAWIYGFNGLVCARPGWDWQWLGVGADSLVLVVSAVVAIGAIGGWSWRVWAHRRHDALPSDAFEVWMTLGLAALSMVAVVYETAAVWLVAGCV